MNCNKEEIEIEIEESETEEIVDSLLEKYITLTMPSEKYGK